MKLEAVLVAYLGSAAMSGLAQTIAPGAVDLFWPSFLGAAIAGMRTLYAAFSKQSADPVIAVAIRAMISLTAGFAVAYYGTDYLLSGIAAGARPPLGFGAVVIGGLGELILSLAIEKMQKTLPARLNADGDRS